MRPPANASATRFALTGGLAAATAFAAAEVVGSVVPGLASPIRLVGGVLVEASPPAVTDFAIRTFGSANVVVLQLGLVVVGLGVGAAIGLVAHGSLAAAIALMTAVASAGPAAALATPEFGLVAAVIPAVAGVAAGGWVLWWLPAVGAEAATASPRTDHPPPMRRRTFVRASATLAVIALAGGAVSRLLPGGGRAGSVAREAVAVPLSPDPLPAPAAGTRLDIEGVTPLFTPNEDFYVVDTALRPPQIDPADWSLRITGLVDRPFALSFDDLLDMATDEADILLSCVSNEVGGDLAGTARWQGVRLDVLLERAGVRPTGTQVVGRAVDGFTVGFPTTAAMDGRDALVAVAMNGEPLPVRHGFPARLVVAGLYGYVSATKWLAEITLETEAFDAYWVPRGWAKEGPVKSTSRIDVPRPGGTVPPGRTAVAGVAWAPLPGVEEVHVRVDEGPWQEARLADELSGSTWRQWVYEWSATQGRHTLAVRAVDREGGVQTSQESPPRPDGATGLHRVTVDVG